MRNIHALIRKLLLRGRHPDEVRNINCLSSKENNRCAKSYAISCAGAGIGHGSRLKSHLIARGHRGRCVESGWVTACLRKVCAGATSQSFTSLGMFSLKGGRNSTSRLSVFDRSSKEVQGDERCINQLRLAGIMTRGEAHVAFTRPKFCNAEQASYRRQIVMLLRLPLGRGKYRHSEFLLRMIGRLLMRLPKIQPYLYRQKLVRLGDFQSSSKVVRSLSVRMTWPLKLFFHNVFNRRKGACALRGDSSVTTGGAE